MSLKFLILLSLADNLNYYKSNYWPYEAIYPFLESYSRSSVRAAVGQLRKSGDLEKIVKNGEVCFSLTLKGFNKLGERFLRPYRGLRSRWDGKWRMIIFDVPERKRKKRGELRRIVKAARFGRLSNSVYLSPFNNLKATVDKIREEFFADLNFFAFEAFGRREFPDKLIAKRAFHLGDLAKKYHAWIRKTKDRQDIDILIAYYEMILESDPALPEELLPPNWPFLKSWAIFIGLLREKAKFAPEKTGS